VCWRRLQILLGHMMCAHNPVLADGMRVDAMRGYKGFQAQRQTRHQAPHQTPHQIRQQTRQQIRDV
jgi:hypothetical protein